MGDPAMPHSLCPERRAGKASKLGRTRIVKGIFIMPSIYQLNPASRIVAPARLYGGRHRQPGDPPPPRCPCCSARCWPVPQHTWLFALIPLWMLLRMALNAVDGMLAREFGQQSKLGAYLNELVTWSPTALPVPSVFAGVSPTLVVLVVVLVVISEYAGVLGPMVGSAPLRRPPWARATAPSASACWVLGWRPACCRRLG